MRQTPRGAVDHPDTQMYLKSESADTNPSSPGVLPPRRGSMVINQEPLMPGALPVSSPIQNSVAHSITCSIAPIPRSPSLGSQVGLGGSNPDFEPLIQVIRGGHAGEPKIPRILRSRVGEDLRKNYSNLSNLSKKEFQKYVQQAEEAGVIEVDSSKRWVQLKLQSDGIS